MRVVVQRVKCAEVAVDGEVVGRIGSGLLVFVGVGEGDSEEDVSYLVRKVAELRVLEDEEGRMNLSPRDVKCEFMVIPQFTLYGDCRKGRRPSFARAAEPTTARSLYESFARILEEEGFTVSRGRFGEHMKVQMVNDGPVTMLVDSRKEF